MGKIKRVLLIDDSNVVNSRNESLLNSMDLFEDIQKFSDPKEAIESLRNDLTDKKKEIPTLIFLDLNMPEMDGFNFLDEYIELDDISKSNYKPLVVIVSDYLDFDNFEKSKRYKTYGVLDHIRKPIDKDDVLNLIEEHF